MTSVEEIIADIESRTENVFFRNLETVDTKILNEVAKMITPRFIDTFLRTTEEGINCGQILIDGRYDQFKSANKTHWQTRRKTNIYHNVFHSIGIAGVDIESIGNITRIMNLFVKYLHDHGDPSYMALYHISLEEPIKEKTKEELRIIGRHFIYLNRHVAAELREQHNFEDFDLTYISQDAVSLIRMKNSHYDCKFEGDPLMIKGDQNTIYVAISNLCKNGISYGNLSIKVSVLREDDFAVVSVVDQGEGISLEELPNVILEGVSYKGSSGLGLAIVSDAIERVHRGRIEIDRGTVAPYIGAEVKLYLPIRQ